MSRMWLSIPQIRAIHVLEFASFRRRSVKSRLDYLGVLSRGNIKYINYRKY